MCDNASTVHGRKAEHAFLPGARQCARRGGRCLPLLVILAAACGGDDRRVPVSLRIDGPQLVTPPGQATFTARQSWSDGSSVDVTAAAQWTSSNPSVLSIAGGLAMALAGGEIGLTATFEGHSSARKTVLVVPEIPEWNGTYTLTVGGGACTGPEPPQPMPPELRQRTFTATVAQNGLTLNVNVPNAGGFGGRIFNPEVRFFFVAGAQNSLRSGITLRRTAATSEPRFYPYGYRRAYSEPVGGPLLVEVLPDGNRLSIAGVVVTTMSPSGFTGTLNGALRLLDRGMSVLLGTCSSSSHVFTLARN